MLSSIKSWLVGDEAPPDQAYTPHRQPAPQRVPHSAPVQSREAPREENEYSHVVFKGRCLKDFPVSHLRRALKEDFQIHASSGALRGDLVRMLGKAVRDQVQPVASPISHHREAEDGQEVYRKRNISMPFSSPSQKRNRDLDVGSSNGVLADAASPGAETEHRPTKRPARAHPGVENFASNTQSASPAGRPREDIPTPWSNPAVSQGIFPPPSRLPAVSSARRPPSLYSRSPAASNRTRPVWVPAAARVRPSADPHVSSAIAKRILETLGEVSQPFQVIFADFARRAVL